ncbi:MAG TPA: 50S ribosomal protein L17 [Candidatus Sphingobacterium stercoripullorum]|nr:50S ribosomal protein L17 [Candidatus Sphingobacterium stercoripullorum]
MRHGKKINSLSRTHSHRKAMLANMSVSLITHKRIKTTLAKAKALRQYVEPLITKSKTDTTHNRRTVFSQLKNKDAVNLLFREISQKVADRPGGYTRIIKLLNRQGDNAEIAIIELVDYNDVYTKETKETKKPTRRRRGGAKKKAAAETVEATEEKVSEVEETKEEKPAVEEEKSENNDKKAE